jgi:hypothetical protein
MMVIMAGGGGDMCTWVELSSLEFGGRKRHKGGWWRKKGGWVVIEIIPRLRF